MAEKKSSVVTWKQDYTPTPKQALLHSVAALFYMAVQQEVVKAMVRHRMLLRLV